jgi:hypothetical protein
MRVAVLSSIVLGMAASLAAAQTTFSAGPTLASAASILIGRALDDAALKPSYHLRLTSDWPQSKSPAGECLNGGNEVLEGVLTRVADTGYEGELRRVTVIRFCGRHADARTLCSITLTGQGPVIAEATVEPGPGSWGDHLVRLRWIPDSSRTEVRVSGDCQLSFAAGLEAMYATVPHAVEFSLPAAGDSDHVTQRLFDYGWIVEVR